MSVVARISNKSTKLKARGFCVIIKQIPVAHREQANTNGREGRANRDDDDMVARRVVVCCPRTETEFLIKCKQKIFRGSI